MDARHEPTELDLMMVGWLDYYEIPFVIALTKADKLPASKMPRYVDAARLQFSRFRHCLDVIPFSAVSGIGKQDVVRLISEKVHKNGETTPKSAPRSRSRADRP